MPYSKLSKKSTTKKCWHVSLPYYTVIKINTYHPKKKENDLLKSLRPYARHLMKLMLVYYLFFLMLKELQNWIRVDGMKNEVFLLFLFGGKLEMINGAFKLVCFGLSFTAISLRFWWGDSVWACKDRFGLHEAVKRQSTNSTIIFTINIFRS